MEDVQSTSGTPNVSNANSSTSANTSASAQVNNNNSQNTAPSGLTASIHAKPSNNQLPQPTPSVQASMSKSQPKKANYYQPTKWTVVQKKKIYSVLIQKSALPDATDDEKKIHAYKMLNDVTGDMTSPFVFATVLGVKVLRTSFHLEEIAKKACTYSVSNTESLSFCMADEYKKKYDAQHFQIRIQDIPLDVDKMMFEDYLNKVDKVISIRYQQPRDLYHTVHVTFANAATRNKLKDLWAFAIGKHSYRFVPADISNEDYLNRFQYRTKLTNLPEGSTAFNVEEILLNVSAKTCFIPKKRDGSYQRERFAFVDFATNDDRLRALETGFQLKGKGLVFTPTSQRTCHTCGSPHHLQLYCQEHNKKQESAARTSQFVPIYNHFNAKPSFPKGYHPSTLNDDHKPDISSDKHQWSEEHEKYWNDLWGIDTPPSSDKNKGKGKPFSYADAAKANANSGPFTFNFTPNSCPWNKNNIKPSAANAPPSNN